MHIPVLAKEAIELLNLKSGDNAIDCTLGGGGHSRMILENTKPKGKILGIDIDPTKLDDLQKEFDKNFPNKAKFVHGNFRDLEKIAHDFGFLKAKAILIDLGFSSFQIEDPNRGLSFQDEEAPLDMRLDQSKGETAADLLNSSKEEEISKKIWEYGQERFARAIAKQIIKRRKNNPYIKTKDLILTVLPFYKKFEYSRRHPATRVFQAMRIWVNDELGSLESVIPQAIEILEPEGRLAIISFHSLEDRIVKWRFRDFAKRGKAKIITKKPIVPSEEEISSNPRARSAKLRVIEKI
ncbi:16S rRNA (cytosine(1402)-N(4))-methyltransferase RsmH [Patescibacteria group bacterium]|nr:MAG: 16S rRNA (cytosine(1402)-N(4))-methyltransferase RsmH [Patescibacteria group bacterium]